MASLKSLIAFSRCSFLYRAMPRPWKAGPNCGSSWMAKLKSVIAMSNSFLFSQASPR
jgi:hypothetical protein